MTPGELHRIPSHMSLIRTAQAPAGTHGKCVKAAESTSVYLILDGAKHIIPDWDTFLSLGCNNPSKRGGLVNMKIRDLYAECLDTILVLGIPAQCLATPVQMCIYRLGCLKIIQGGYSLACLH